MAAPPVASSRGADDAPTVLWEPIWRRSESPWPAPARATSFRNHVLQRDVEQSNLQFSPALRLSGSQIRAGETFRQLASRCTADSAQSQRV
jgi:hypothetical protein